MRALLLLMFTMHFYAHAFFPVVETKSDIKSFFPTSKKEIFKLKEDVISSFSKSIDEILYEYDSKYPGKNIIQKWDKTLGEVMIYSKLLSSLSIVLPSKSLRQACQSAANEIEQKVHEKIMKSPELYETIKKAELDESLNEEDRRFLFDILDSFKAMGIHLKDEVRSNLIDISSSLTELCAAFQMNISEDNSYILASDSDLEGLSDFFKMSLKKNNEGYYILTCDYPTVFPVLAQCRSAKVRKALLNAFFNRAYPENITILEEIISKRDEKAKILGFESFADFQLNQMLIKSPEKAQEFLIDLLERISSKAKIEFTNLKMVADSDFAFSEKGRIFPYDTYFLWNKYRQKNRLLDSEMISEYFPLDNLLENMCMFLEELYGITINLFKTDDLWVEGIIVLQIQKKENVLGHIILDVFPREGKFSHAGMSPIIPACVRSDGTSFPALNMVITNCPKSKEGLPALMTMKDVETLYHELGHAFHDIIGRTNYMLTSGTNVPQDFVEMPSQLMEEWLYEKGHLKSISCHYKKNEPLSDDMIDNIINSRKDDIATSLQKQIFFSLLSLEYFKEGSQKDTSSIYDELYLFCHPNYELIPGHHFQASFGHLDGYGATYYGYLWSKVTALDIFESFKKDNVSLVERFQEYVDQVLSKGNGTDLISAVEFYLGRKIKIDSFLKRLSINAME